MPPYVSQMLANDVPKIPNDLALGSSGVGRGYFALEINLIISLKGNCYIIGHEEAGGFCARDAFLPPKDKHRTKAVRKALNVW